MLLPTVPTDVLASVAFELSSVLVTVDSLVAPDVIIAVALVRLASGVTGAALTAVEAFCTDAVFEAFGLRYISTPVVIAATTMTPAMLPRITLRGFGFCNVGGKEFLGVTPSDITLSTASGFITYSIRLCFTVYHYLLPKSVCKDQGCLLSLCLCTQRG